MQRICRVGPASNASAGPPWVQQHSGGPARLISRLSHPTSSVTPTSDLHVNSCKIATQGKAPCIVFHFMYAVIFCQDQTPTFQRIIAGISTTGNMTQPQSTIEKAASHRLPTALPTEHIARPTNAAMPKVVSNRDPARRNKSELM